MSEDLRLLIVLGSARSDGDTRRAVTTLRRELVAPGDLLDLSTLDIGPFDYRGAGRRDDFGAAVERMLAARAILFATPVYWYAMSGRMKTLFDRFTDLLSDRDPDGRGRRLAGRQLWMLAVGADPELPPGFEEPFRLTAAYLGGDWRGGCYVPAPDPPGRRRERLAAFAGRIDAALD